MGFGGGFDEQELGGDGAGGEGGDQGVLAGEGVREGREGVVVDWDGGHRGGEGVRAAGAG